MPKRVTVDSDGLNRMIRSSIGCPHDMCPRAKGGGPAMRCEECRRLVLDIRDAEDAPTCVENAMEIETEE